MGFLVSVLTYVRGVRKKVDPVLKAQIFRPMLGLLRPTYYVPHQWKLNKAFAELCRFEIAALIESSLIMSNFLLFKML